jgi:PAS domain S-box-containing protein
MNGRRPPRRQSANFSAALVALPLAQAGESLLQPLLVASAAVGVALALVALWTMWRRRRDSAHSRMRDQWLVTMLRSIGDGVIGTDAAGRVTFMNGVAQELTGWKENDAAQIPLAKIFRTLDRATRQPGENPIDRVVREGRSTSTAEPVLLIALDGAERFVLSDASPIRDAGRAVSGVVLVFRDVTERELADSAFRASQEMFRTITDHISDYVSVLDLEGRRLFASNSFERSSRRRANCISRRRSPKSIPTTANESAASLRKRSAPASASARNSVSSGGTARSSISNPSPRSSAIPAVGRKRCSSSHVTSARASPRRKRCARPCTGCAGKTARWPSRRAARNCSMPATTKRCA